MAEILLMISICFRETMARQLNIQITSVAFFGDRDFCPTTETQEDSGIILSLAKEKSSRDAVAIEATPQAKIETSTNKRSA